jgi:GxxExxY protein
MEMRTNAEPADGAVENAVTDKVIAAAIEVHRHLGPGLLESTYEECLCCELSLRGMEFQRQVHLPVSYKGVKLECGYEMDLLVADSVVIELKTVDDLAPVHHSQLLTYLKLANKRVGLLINFNVPVLRNGLKRIVNRYAGPSIAEATPVAFSPRLPPRLRVSAIRNRPL